MPRPTYWCVPRLRMPGLWVLCWLVLVSGFTSARELVIVGTVEAPLKISHDGNHSGIDVDIVAEAMRRLEIDHRFILVESGTRMLQMLLQGTADMGLALSHSEEREALAYYPETAYLELSWNFFIHRDNLAKIQFTDYSDLRGWRIGATQGYSYTDGFWNADLELDIITQNELHLGKLRAKRIDAVPLNTLVTRYELRQSGHAHEITYLQPPLRSALYYNVFSKASDYPNLPDLVARYNEVITEMMDDGTIAHIMASYLD